MLPVMVDMLLPLLTPCLLFYRLGPRSKVSYLLPARRTRPPLLLPAVITFSVYFNFILFQRFTHRRSTELEFQLYLSQGTFLMVTVELRSLFSLLFQCRIIRFYAS